jgi:hypothetical protein
MKKIHPVNAIRHPLWWAMLAVLIANDWWLKSASVLPTSVTGKISDFAGLMVFPLLAALILGPLSQRKFVWAGIHIITGILFTAVNLIPSAANLYVNLLNSIGFHAQIWQDPTDLAALIMLPLSFLIYPRLTPMIRMNRSGQLLRCFSIAFAGFFCMASSSTGAVSAPRTLTSYNGDLMVSDVAFINGTNDDISVQVERLKDNIEVNCDQPIDANRFKDDQFKSLGTFKQTPGEATTLLPATTNPDDNRCRVVKLTINNVESVLVAWNPAKTGTVDLPIKHALPLTPETLPHNAILLHREKKDYYMLAKGDFTLTYWRKDLFAVDYWKM